MNVITRAPNRMGDPLQSAKGSAKVFMNAVALGWSHPRFAVLGAEDQMVVQGEMRRGHEEGFSRSCRSAM